ncbi:RNA polymerase sigma-70 factor, ECF subfamily [Salegentibacter agarivorans]|uniref:RNA polymerase sigma-70 factor, ECF subfamily n=1 Tax=Salegentibacter agarivorans TaxID=345907 RepID=A0A1I2NLG7_9FLAO|nr:sigma-70 family RNA polymerase sigma factor [Salegentibacter agarivorans]SFG03629.1 RNA polymerase sigma-70 factor, ECF subfamily [Salegentibacter agarivorans]
MVNEKKFDQIYNEHWFEIYTYSNNLLRDKEAAEDVTQEIFLDLWKRFATLEIENYKHYLLRACKFQCIKRLKKVTFDHVQLEKVEYALSSMEESICEDEVRSVLLAQVESNAQKLLPPKCYAVFWLRYKENLSYIDISSRLGISVNTVENHISKALSLLKQASIYDDIVTISLIVSGMASLIEC